MSQLTEAIYARQLAAGVGVGDRIDPAGTYNLAQLKAYVNGMPTQGGVTYVVGTYSGGVAVPTEMDGTYADSAADEADLLALVLALLTTYHHGAVVHTENATAQAYSGTGNDLDYETAKLLAAADYGPVGVSSQFLVKASWTAATSNATLSHDTVRMQCEQMDTTVTRNVRYFGQMLAAPGGTYDTQGISWLADVAENSYALLATSSAVTLATDTSTDLSTTSTQPDAWPAGDGALGVSLGVGALFALCDWDFADEAPNAEDYVADEMGLGSGVISLQAGNDEVYRVVATSPELQWAKATPDPSVFPAAPTNGQTYEDKPSGTLWYYWEPDSKWHARWWLTHIEQGIEAVWHQNVVVPAGQVYVDCKLITPLSTGLLPVVQATAWWEAVSWPSYVTAERFRLNVDPAPTYDAYVSLYITGTSANIVTL